MEQPDLRTLQLAQLEIAKELKRVCEILDVKYFMDSGTLLGAIRHGGFIPWDDDMDFAMVREEYDRFLALAPSVLSGSYYLQTWDSDPQYPYGFAKLRKIGTVYEEKLTEGLLDHNELYIDIFPYDHYPDSFAVQILHNRRIMLYRHAYLMHKGVKPWRIYSSLPVRAAVFLRYIPARIFSLFAAADKVKAGYIKEVTRYNSVPAGKLCELTSGIPYGGFVVPAKCFESMAMHPFEDTEFALCEDYDTFLTSLYGDYMTPPKESKRGGRHGVIETKLD